MLGSGSGTCPVLDRGGAPVRAQGWPSPRLRLSPTRPRVPLGLEPGWEEGTSREAEPGSPRRVYRAAGRRHGIEAAEKGQCEGRGSRARKPRPGSGSQGRGRLLRAAGSGPSFGAGGTWARGTHGSAHGGGFLVTAECTRPGEGAGPLRARVRQAPQPGLPGPPRAGPQRGLCSERRGQEVRAEKPLLAAWLENKGSALYF